MLTNRPDGFLDDLGGLASPDEWSRVLVPAVDVPLDVFHEGPDRVEGAPANGLTGQDAEPASTMFNHEAPVGVKWKCTRGCASSHAWTAGVLCVDELSRMTCREAVSEDAG